MKKVIALWLDQSNFPFYFNNLDHLVSSHSFIGFIPDGRKDKYMIVTSGGVRGSAVQPTGRWSDDQKKSMGQYFIFDTKNELLEWMKD